jgi:hypothetical protein
MNVTTLRRLPVPASEPPYDDESAGHRPPPLPPGAVQGTLALAFVLPNGVPAAPAAPPGLRLVAAGPEPDADDFGPQPTGTFALPGARRWAGRFAQAVVEVLAGDRPLAQLVRWTTTEVYDDVAALIVGPGTVGPGGAVASTRGVVRSVHVSEPADGVAEVAALVRRGARSTAVAMRLEGLDGRWQCTALELG